MHLAPPISSSVTFSPMTISAMRGRAQVHGGVPLDHDDQVAERGDVGAAGGRRPEEQADLRHLAGELHLVVEDAPCAAPAGEHLHLVGDARAGRVHQVEQRAAAALRAVSWMRRIFSTVRAPQLPAFTVESFAMRATVRPSILPEAGDDAVGGQLGVGGVGELPVLDEGVRDPGGGAMRSRANSLPASVFFAWYFGAPPSRMPGAARAEGVVGRHAARGLTTGGAAPVRRSYRWASVDPFPKEGAHHGVLGHRRRIHQELPLHEPRPGRVRLWNRLGDLDLGDFDKERLLRKVGVVPYSPGSRTRERRRRCSCSGGLVGAVVGLALAPKPGAELRSDVRERAMNLFDQVKNKAEDVERRLGIAPAQRPFQTGPALLGEGPQALEAVLRAEDRLVLFQLERERGLDLEVDALGRRRAWPRRRRAARSRRSAPRAARPTSSRRPSGASRFTSPMAKASAALMRRPVRMRSLARPGPMSRGSRWVPPPPGMMPEPHLGEPQLRGGRGDAEVARQRELGAAAEGRAVDGGDEDAVALLDGAQDAAEPAEEGADLGLAHGGAFLEVGAGAEGLVPGAGEDDDPDVLGARRRGRRASRARRARRRLMALRVSSASSVQISTGPRRSSRKVPMCAISLDSRA